MFSYRVKYTESESDILNYNLFYKNTKNAKILSKIWKMFENRTIHFFLFCFMYKLYDSYFVIWGNFVILGFFDFYIYIDITRVGLLHVQVSYHDVHYDVYHDVRQCGGFPLRSTRAPMLQQLAASQPLHGGGLCEGLWKSCERVSESERFLDQGAKTRLNCVTRLNCIFCKFL